MGGLSVGIHVHIVSTTAESEALHWSGVRATGVEGLAESSEF